MRSFRQALSLPISSTTPASCLLGLGENNPWHFGAWKFRVKVTESVKNSGAKPELDTLSSSHLAVRVGTLVEWRFAKDT